MISDLRFWILDSRQYYCARFLSGRFCLDSVVLLPPKFPRRAAWGIVAGSTARQSAGPRELAGSRPLADRKHPRRLRRLPFARRQTAVGPAAALVRQLLASFGRPRSRRGVPDRGPLLRWCHARPVDQQRAAPVPAPSRGRGEAAERG